MHASQDVRIVKCMDGLHYSFAMLDHVYAGMHELCSGIPTDESLLPQALWRCWSFIDILHRIREISQAIPGLSKKNEQLVDFLAATTQAETFRHYIQHLREELSKPGTNKHPVWGSLSWVDPKDASLSHLVVIGAQHPGISYSGCVYDQWERKWVSKVCLDVEGRSFNFDPAFEACGKFRAFIFAWAAEIYQPGFRFAKKPPVISTQMLFQAAPPEAAEPTVPRP